MKRILIESTEVREVASFPVATPKHTGEPDGVRVGALVVPTTSGSEAEVVAGHVFELGDGSHVQIGAAEDAEPVHLLFEANRIQRTTIDRRERELRDVHGYYGETIGRHRNLIEDLYERRDRYRSFIAYRVRRAYRMTIAGIIAAGVAGVLAGLAAGWLL